mgnify:CR=1 FL=1
MANEENLIPFNERTESEQRQIAQKGGIASGAARRRKRSMKEAADYYLSLPETDRRRVNAPAGNSKKNAQLVHSGCWSVDVCSPVAAGQYKSRRVVDMWSISLRLSTVYIVPRRIGAKQCKTVLLLASSGIFSAITAALCRRYTRLRSIGRR